MPSSERESEGEVRPRIWQGFIQLLASLKYIQGLVHGRVLALSCHSAKRRPGHSGERLSHSYRTCTAHWSRTGLRISSEFMPAYQTGGYRLSADLPSHPFRPAQLSVQGGWLSGEVRATALFCEFAYGRTRSSPDGSWACENGCRGPNRDSDLGSHQHGTGIARGQ
jgi:hypothetical protein